MGSEEGGDVVMAPLKRLDVSSHTNKYSCMKLERCKSAPHNRICEEGVEEEEEEEEGKLVHPKLKLDLEQIKSDIDARKKQALNNHLQASLKQEISQLQKRLKGQMLVRQALEKALGYREASADAINGKLVPKSTVELIKEITVLETEVMYLEQYLLSLYRQAFAHNIPTLSSGFMGEGSSMPLKSREFSAPQTSAELKTRRANTTQSSRVLFAQNCVEHTTNHSGMIDKQMDSGVQRCHSSLSDSSISPSRNSPSEAAWISSQRNCRSQPLSSTELQNGNSGVISLADHLGTSIAEHILETPNKLSEDIVKCMASIYCKLAEPPMQRIGLSSSSPTSSLSSISTSSPRYQCDLWSPPCKQETSGDIRMENPFQIEHRVESDGPYSTMVEIPWVCTVGPRMKLVESMMQSYRLLVRRLEKVDPSKLKHAEKVAFWTNIHNALVMHTYLTYGIPHNNIKRASLLFKAGYNVGGLTISADTIQNSILGCRTHRPAQWLRALLSSKFKFRVGDEKQSYALRHPEPLLYFALCTGCYSDPAVRVYTAKRIFQELDAAKEEYVQASVGIRNEQQLVFPKILESFARDSCLSSEGLLHMVRKCLPKSEQKTMKKCLKNNPQKSIEWLPYNFTHRYLLAKDLIRT